MSKRLLLTLFLTVGLCACAATAQSLVPIDPATVSDGHVYLFEGVTGTDLPDDSANNNAGTLIGGPAVVEGLSGEALQFDGVDDGVTLPDSQFINVTGGPFPNRTVIAVFKCDDVTKSDKQTIFEEGGRTRGLVIYVHEGLVYVGGWNRSEYNWNPGSWLSAPIGSNEWHAVVMVIRDGAEAEEADKFEMWMDGLLIGKAVGGQIHNHGDDTGFGHTNQNTVFHDDDGSGDNRDWFGGVIDEIWVLNEALTEVQLSQIGLSRTNAKNPIPASEAVDVLRDTTLIWEAGEFAQTHDVYLGTAFDDVNDASRASPMDVLVSQGQVAANYDPGRLEFGQTYYWRVDEVNGAPDNTIYKGETWSFEVEPFAYPVENISVVASSADADADPENTVNGSGLDEAGRHSVASEGMWVSSMDGAQPTTIEFTFENVYKLHEMRVWNYNVQFEGFLGYGMKDVTVEYSENGVDWIALGDFEFAQAPASDDYTYNTTVAFDGLAVQAVRLTAHSNWGDLYPQYGLSEVHFMSIPVSAREPQPGDGSSDVGVDSTLTWRAGREADVHEVYLGTDPDALVLADTTSEASYAAASLDLDMVYYWKVAEVNEAEAITAWDSTVWSFSTEGYLVVDDFESYNDDDNLIYETWIDGWVNETGSTVGHAVGPFAEQTIVHGGSQSMPLFYDNSGVDTAEADLDLNQNWTAHGIKSLSLYFYGDVTNSGGQLFVRINNTRIDYDGSAVNVTRPSWQSWNIDLSTAGNVSNVQSLTIGIEGAGGERRSLHRRRPAISHAHRLPLPRRHRRRRYRSGRAQRRRHDGQQHGWLALGRNAGLGHRRRHRHEVSPLQR